HGIEATQPQVEALRGPVRTLWCVSAQSEGGPRPAPVAWRDDPPISESTLPLHDYAERAAWDGREPGQRVTGTWVPRHPSTAVRPRGSRPRRWPRSPRTWNPTSC